MEQRKILEKVENNVKKTDFIDLNKVINFPSNQSGYQYIKNYASLTKNLCFKNDLVKRMEFFLAFSTKIEELNKYLLALSEEADLSLSYVNRRFKIRQSLSYCSNINREISQQLSCIASNLSYIKNNLFWREGVVLDKDNLQNLLNFFKIIRSSIEKCKQSQWKINEICSGMTRMDNIDKIKVLFRIEQKNRLR